MNLGQTSQHHHDSWKDSVMCRFCRTGSCRSPWIVWRGFSAERLTWGEWPLSSSRRDTHLWPILSLGNARRATAQALRSQRAAVCVWTHSGLSPGCETGSCCIAFLFTTWGRVGKTLKCPESFLHPLEKWSNTLDGTKSPKDEKVN